MKTLLSTPKLNLPLPAPVKVYLVTSGPDPDSEDFLRKIRVFESDCTVWIALPAWKTRAAAVYRWSLERGGEPVQVSGLPEGLGPGLSAQAASQEPALQRIKELLGHWDVQLDAPTPQVRREWSHWHFWPFRKGAFGFCLDAGNLQVAVWNAEDAARLPREALAELTHWSPLGPVTEHVVAEGPEVRVVARRYSPEMVSCSVAGRLLMNPDGRYFQFADLLRLRAPLKLSGGPRLWTSDSQDEEATRWLQLDLDEMSLEYTTERLGRVSLG